MTELINKLTIRRKGLLESYYHFPTLKDLLEASTTKISISYLDYDGLVEALKSYYELKSAHNVDIDRLTTQLNNLLSLDSQDNLKFQNETFLNVKNLQDPPNITALTSDVTDLKGRVTSLEGNVSTIGTALTNLQNDFNRHQHSLIDLTDVSKDGDFLKFVQNNNNYYIELLNSKDIIKLTAYPNDANLGTVYVTPLIKSGENALLVAEPKESYIFKRWTINGTQISTNPIHIVAPTLNTIYTGVFEAQGLTETDYLLTFNVDDTNKGSIKVTLGSDPNPLSTSLRVPRNTQVHIQALPKTSSGYAFDYWEGISDSIKYDAETEFSMVADTDIVAHFKVQDCDVRIGKAINTSGVALSPDYYPTVEVNGIAKNNNFSVPYNTVISLSANANIGNYIFKNWSHNSSLTNNNISVTVKGVLETQPVYEIPKFTVNFSADNEAAGNVKATYLGSTTQLTSPVSISKGSHLVFTATPSSGYVFNSWEGLPTGSLASDVVVNDDLTIIAHFSAETPSTPTVFTIHFGEKPNGVWSPFGSEVAVTVGNTVVTNPYIVEGDYVDIPSSTVKVTGYELLYWEDYEHDILDYEALHTSATNGTEYYGIFQKLTYTITVQSDTSQGTITGGGTYSYNDTVTIEANPKPGYHFVQWNDGNTNPLRSFAATDNVTYTAIFALNTYTITASASPAAGGSIEGLEESYDYGDTCRLTATANSGYEFVEWTEGNTGVSSNATYEFTVNNQRTLVAVFNKKSYEITTSATTGGTASPATQTAEHGDPVTVTATPDTGYSFTKWTRGTSDTAVSTNAIYQFTATGPDSLKANFTINKYTVTIAANPTAGGSANIVDPASDNKYEYGTELTLTQSANTGYTFSNWSGGTVTDNKIIVTGPLTLKANFTKNTYKVSASVDPTGSGTVKVNNVANNTNVAHGDSATLVATAGSGYTFVNWTLNGTQVATTASYTTPAITGPASYVAHFNEIPVTDNTIYYYTSGVATDTSIEGKEGTAILLSTLDDKHYIDFSNSSTTIQVLTIVSPSAVGAIKIFAKPAIGAPYDATSEFTLTNNSGSYIYLKTARTIKGPYYLQVDNV